MNIIIDVFGAILEVLIIWTFFQTFLGNIKVGKKETYAIYIIFFVGVNFLSFFTAYPLILSSIMLLLTFIVSLFYSSSLRVKIFSSLIITVLSILSEAFVGFLIAIFISKDIKFITSNIYFYILGLLVSKLIVFIIVKALQYYKLSNKGLISYGAFFSLILFPITTVITIYILTKYAYTITSFNELLLVVASILLSISSNIIIIYIFEKQIKQEQEKSNFMIIQQQLKLQAEYFKELAEKQRTSNAAIHDAKNKLYAISSCLNNNDSLNAKEKINELCNNILDSINISKTGNDALDALINSKYKRIKDNGIDFKTSIFISKINEIDDIDLCVIIGNALDNAIESCMKIQKNDKLKHINLKIAQIGENLSIEITNSSLQKLVVNDGVLQTSKSDKYSHGFGIKSMIEISNKYNGHLNYTNENGEFKLKIFMQNKITSPNMQK